MILLPSLRIKRWSSKEGLEGDPIVINVPDQVVLARSFFRKT